MHENGLIRSRVTCRNEPAFSRIANEALPNSRWRAFRMVRGNFVTTMTAETAPWNPSIPQNSPETARSKPSPLAVCDESPAASGGSDRSITHDEVFMLKIHALPSPPSHLTEWIPIRIAEMPSCLSLGHRPKPRGDLLAQFAWLTNASPRKSAVSLLPINASSASHLSEFPRRSNS